jgi:DNA repair/transcription protein MET18/MMS19
VLTALDAGLESKELKLVDVIESLAEYLNHDDAPLRAKSTEDSSNSPINILTSAAMSFLAEMLQAMAPKVLSLQQSKFSYFVWLCFPPHPS